MHKIHSLHPLAIAINPKIHDFQRINPSSTLHLQLHALSSPYIVESIVKFNKKKERNCFYDFVVSTNYVHDVNHSRIHTRKVSTKKVLFHDDDEIYVGNSKDKRKWKGITLLTLSFCCF